MSSLAAAKLPNYEHVINEAVKFGKEKGGYVSISAYSIHHKAARHLSSPL